MVDEGELESWSFARASEVAFGGSSTFNVTYIIRPITLGAIRSGLAGVVSLPSSGFLVAFQRLLGSWRTLEGANAKPGPRPSSGATPTKNILVRVVVASQASAFGREEKSSRKVAVIDTVGRRLNLLSHILFWHACVESRFLR